jgi:hypothetical protein
MLMRILLLYSLLTLSACQVLNPNFYKPGPSEPELYRKPGASKNDVIKVMTECSNLHPVFRRPDDTMEEQILRQRCMLEDGFQYLGQFGPFCEWSENRNMPACQPDAVIPKRDPQRRLNSQFCKTNSTWKICQPGS